MSMKLDIVLFEMSFDNLIIFRRENVVTVSSRTTIPQKSTWVLSRSNHQYDFGHY